MNVIFANPDRLRAEEESQIIDAVTQHQVSCAEWGRSEVVQAILHWMPLLIAEFKVHTPDFHVPDLAFCVDKLPVRTMGYYRGTYNGYGLRREIAFNSEYIAQFGKGKFAEKIEDTETFYDVIGTLAHELVHAYQDVTETRSGKRNHHNEHFRAIALTMGLEVNAKGEQLYGLDGKFFDFLKGVKPDIKVPQIIDKPIGQQKKKKGKSPLRKWVCDCQNVRAGKLAVFLRCEKPDGCGKMLRLGEDESDGDSDGGVPCEEPLLDGQVVQNFPK